MMNHRLEVAVATDPLVQFAEWFAAAKAVMVDQLYNAMVLATVSSDHQPSARVVLLKEFSAVEGFVFYTNYNSHKGLDLVHNPRVALVFWWEALQRQVRIEGVAQIISAKKSDEYFHSRPRASQIAALASEQSHVIPNREQLMLRYHELVKQYEHEAVIPRPTGWGGYQVMPSLLEFWQGGTDRLHDRFQYTKDANGVWIIQRLAP